MVNFTDLGVPTHQELVLPILRAIKSLGNSAASTDLVSETIDSIPNSEELLDYTYPNRPSVPVLHDRVTWGRSTAKRIGALEQPSRGMYLLTDFGETLLELDEAQALQKVKDIDREIYREKRKADKHKSDEQIDDEIEADFREDENTDDELSEGLTDWKEELLSRLHQLTPEGFEKFVIYLLKRYKLKLTHQGGSGDEGIDAIGMAPLSPVLSSRVAVQIKRYAPDGKPIGRETVALFQRDAATKGAERAILVTLSRFTEPARKAAISATPTVNLIDGQDLAKLILDDGQSGVQMAPVVDKKWFNQFD